MIKNTVEKFNKKVRLHEKPVYEVSYGFFTFFRKMGTLFDANAIQHSRTEIIKAGR